MTFIFQADNMSFYRITDPKKRDAMVAEYVSTLKRIKKRDFEEKIGDFHHYEDTQRNFKPIIQSNKKLVEDFKKELRVKKEETDSQVKKEETDPLVEIEEADGPYTKKLKNSLQERNPDVDTAYGIYFREGIPLMGNKHITLQQDDIVVENEVYDSTPGLWKLITGTTEDQIGHYKRDYTEDDLEQYIKLLNQTNVLYHDFDSTKTSPRSSRSWKWTNVLSSIWKQIKKRQQEEEGSGIKFLPSSIKELEEKLKVLTGEYTAGNTTVRNELVAVLDQLRTRNAITEKEYTLKNSKL